MMVWGTGNIYTNEYKENLGSVEVQDLPMVGLIPLCISREMGATVYSKHRG